MKKDLVTVHPEETIFKACMKYRDEKIGCLLVLKDKYCVGILTERDIIERVICNNLAPKKTKVEDIMTKDIITINKLSKIKDALNLMDFNHIKKLPVVSEDELVGIVTIHDLALAKGELTKRFMDSWIKSRWID
ncbi:MAG: CBS domain-containing protein [Candidatus Thermoplasmatota archaeon]